MEDQIVTDGKYRYIEIGEGKPMIILHGLMGGSEQFPGRYRLLPSEGLQGVGARTPHLRHAPAENQCKEFRQIP